MMTVETTKSVFLWQYRDMTHSIKVTHSHKLLDRDVPQQPELITLESSSTKFKPTRNQMKNLFVLNNDGLSITQISIHRSSQQPHKWQKKFQIALVFAGETEKERGRQKEKDELTIQQAVKRYMCDVIMKCVDICHYHFRTVIREKTHPT